jgi:hypothetical protein
MSGALIELVSKGAQDIYIINDTGASFFKIKYTRHTNFAQTPKQLELIGNTVTNSGYSTIRITSLGDLVNNVWLEGENLVENLLGTVFDLYIGGQKVDSQTYDFMADIWQIYMAETYTKSRTINNKVSQSNNQFFPLHFFFCDNSMFLPVLALQYSEIEIRITWGGSVSSTSNVKAYANYVYLDTTEREDMIKKPMEILITQVQKHIFSREDQLNCDLAMFNHPVKSIYFGFEAKETFPTNDKFSFSSADIHLNGTPLFEKMSPTFFHTVQGYYRSQYGVITYDVPDETPFYTRYFTYNFCIDASSYKPTGTCNFSRLDNAKLVLRDVSVGSGRTTDNINVYAVNYNILKIQSGIAGILFAN